MVSVTNIHNAAAILQQNGRKMKHLGITVCH